MPGSSVLHRSLAVLGLVLACATTQAGYSALYVFGDSLSDSGNDYLLTRGAVPNGSIYTDGVNAGRFTNGLNYADLLAAKLGVTLAPSLIGGTNYAYGGARTASVALPGSLTFNQQITQYSTTIGSADSNALYTLWIGANDLSDAIAATALGSPTALADTITLAMTGIANAIGTLALMGAEHFLIPNLPDMALVPELRAYNSADLSALATMASMSFNTALADMLMSDAFAALDIRTFDVFAAQHDMTEHPELYGLTNVADGCYTGFVDGSSLTGSAPETCATPDEYFYWDFEHPSARVHAELARLAFAAVPEPQTWSLVLAGLGLATFMRRRRQH